MTDYRDYEIAVADILRSKVGDAATVEHDQHLPGRRSGASRQVDVLVRGTVFGLAQATLVVDCKLWNSRVDVADVGTFVDLVEDVGADFGLLVTTDGYTRAAATRVQDARGVSAEVVTLDQLRGWSPRGTYSTSLRLPIASRAQAESSLRRAGFRVREDPGLGHADDEVVLEAFRHYGKRNPTGEEQQAHLDSALDALRGEGITAEAAATGITVGGGTPAHRWLEVTDQAGHRLGLKVLAASDSEVDDQLTRVASQLGVPREDLDVDRPADWPFRHAFQ